MSSTKTDPGTPIFGELNQELELPNIEVQDFEPFGFDFSTDPAADRGETEETADAAASDSAAETDSAAQPSETSATESAARGGRRRKES